MPRRSGGLRKSMAKRVWRAGGIGWRMSRDDTCIVCVAEAALISQAMSARKEMPGSSNWRGSIPHHHISNPPRSCLCIRWHCGSMVLSVYGVPFADRNLDQCMQQIMVLKTTCNGRLVSVTTHFYNVSLSEGRPIECRGTGRAYHRAKPR